MNMPYKWLFSEMLLPTLSTSSPHWLLNSSLLEPEQVRISGESMLRRMLWSTRWWENGTHWVLMLSLAAPFLCQLWLLSIAQKLLQVVGVPWIPCRHLKIVKLRPNLSPILKRLGVTLKSKSPPTTTVNFLLARIKQ